MDSIIIKGDKTKLDLIRKLAKELGLSEQRIKTPLSEDQALGILADTVKTGKTVSKSSILKKLKSI